MSLHKGLTSGEVCSECGSRIHKDTHRASYGYKTRWGTSFIRICAFCILSFTDEIDNKIKNEYKEMKKVIKLEKKTIKK